MGVHPEKVVNSVELEELRVLTEVSHLLSAMDETGSIPVETLAGVEQNLVTASYEIAMPAAVSKVEHEIVYESEQGNGPQRIITWLGRNMVDNAENGRTYHWSAAAHSRVDIEVAAARYEQRDLRAGTAQVFISPKMSRQDASVAVAKSEHLHDDDSVRVSKAIVNDAGEVIGRELQSLLVRDIPLESWVSMLTDAGNIFGREFTLRDEASALSVMELFADLELNESKLPEGPINLVEAVLPYIKDNGQYDSVARQVAGFRGDQTPYRLQAERTAQVWLEFDIELAKSLKAGEATSAIKTFIMQRAHQWDQSAIELIDGHSRGDTQYEMTRQLAAMLERAKRKLLTDNAAIIVGNEHVLEQLRKSGREQLITDVRLNEQLRATNMIDHEEHLRRQAQLDGEIASANVKGGGGCPGDTAANFGGSDGKQDSADSLNSQVEQTTDWERGKRTWKKGVCQVKVCLSPKPTEVGPCSVCKHCQAVFDKGGDPTKSFFGAIKTKTKQDEFEVSRASSASFNKQVDTDFSEADMAAVEAEAARRSQNHKRIAETALAG